MGFRTGAYAKVWEVTPMTNTITKIRLSISHKNKSTGEYEQDFSGYAVCVGTAVAQKAAHLQKGSRIKIGDCDVSTKYDAAKSTTYTNFKIFSFESFDDSGNSSDGTEPEVIDFREMDDSRLPF